jgi:Family of unknown function (DUF6510)
MNPIEGGADGDSARESGAVESGAVESGAVEPKALEGWVLDGNAIGGLLIEVFGTEMTTAVGTCSSCGRASQVAELAVYQPGLGTVVRCRNCNGILMVFVQRHEVTCVDLMGLASLA